jgi:hypothetical protein
MSLLNKIRMKFLTVAKRGAHTLVKTSDLERRRTEVFLHSTMLGQIHLLRNKLYSNHRRVELSRMENHSTVGVTCRSGMSGVHFLVGFVVFLYYII